MFIKFRSILRRKDWMKELKPYGLYQRKFSTANISLGKYKSIKHSYWDQHYTKIVVGAGSAGCVLANRLTEDSDTNVLLVEAGPKDTILGSKLAQWMIHMPAALAYNLCDDRYNWYYETTPQKHANNRQLYWPRGRVWGGSSSLNAMVYMRGHAHDYDRWEREGVEGWNYANCLPYFKKAQNHEYGEDEYRGGSGPLNVSRGDGGNILQEVWIKAGQEAGYPLTEDHNGYQQEGVGRFDSTIYKGLRWSAASAYLRPALSRKNLTTLTGVLITKVLFDGKKAIGVEVMDKGVTRKIKCDEVILSGGAINTPQILMLSGIGDADHIKQMEIPVVEHLPGVGSNLQDHLEVPVGYQCTKPVTLLEVQRGLKMIKVGIQWFINRTGAASTTHYETGGFIRSSPGVPHPDIMFHFVPSQVTDHGRVDPTLEAFQVHVGPMRATSVGTVRLSSADPRHAPLMDPNYLSTERDRWEMRQSIRLSREIFSQAAFDPYRGEEMYPGAAFTSDDDLDEFVRNNCNTTYHPSCTCKMGSEDDKEAVVDKDGMVMGVENLRVVDASIMPSIVSANLNAPTIMIAEKLADVIRGKEPLPPSAGVKVYEADTTRQR